MYIIKGDERIAPLIVHDKKFCHLYLHSTTRLFLVMC